ncbi:Non-specific lipid-transfer protein, partial [Melia azedarach]
MSSQVLAVFAVLLLTSGSAMGIAPPDCNSVLVQLNPCVPYLSKNEAKPQDACCSGVKNLKQYSNDKVSRQAICRCLETVAPMYGQIDYSLISALPRQCSVAVKLPAVSP